MIVIVYARSGSDRRFKVVLSPVLFDSGVCSEPIPAMHTPSSLPLSRGERYIGRVEVFITTPWSGCHTVV